MFKMKIALNKVVQQCELLIYMNRLIILKNIFTKIYKVRIYRLA